ncbi:MAG TPA: iron-sulfur cluster assembly scaffold protein [Allosphingosinicella sp.]|nr:iron-sulfur cluster assembly scaffold protein [Allosphingosinicella sp.]
MPAVTATLYSRDILRLAASIPHLGRLPGAQASVERNSVVCGSRVAVDLSLDDAGRVAAVGLEVKACALGQASAALLGAHVIGSDAAALAAARDALGAYLAGEQDEPGAWPGFAVFADARGFTARHPSIRLAFEAAAAAAALAAGEGADRSSPRPRLPD